MLLFLKPAQVWKTSDRIEVFSRKHTNMKLTSSYQDFLGHHRRRSTGYVASETVRAFEHRCRLLRGMFPATIRSHFCYFCFWPIKIRSELISDACSTLVEHLKRWPSSCSTQHISDADGKKERSDWSSLGALRIHVFVWTSELIQMFYVTHLFQDNVKCFIIPRR